MNPGREYVSAISLNNLPSAAASARWGLREREREGGRETADLCRFVSGLTINKQA